MSKIRIFLGIYFLLALNISAQILEHQTCWLQLPEEDLCDEESFDYRNTLRSKGYILIKAGNDIPSLSINILASILQIFHHIPPRPKEYFPVDILIWEGKDDQLPQCLRTGRDEIAVLRQEVSEERAPNDDGCDSP